MGITFNEVQYRRQIRRLPPAMVRGAGHGVQRLLDRFEADFKPNRLQQRTPSSVGPRTRDMLDSFKTRVRVGRNRVTGRAFFDGPDKLQMIVAVLEKGATIRPKRGKHLKFKLHRRYARGAWPFPGTEQWIATPLVVIPPYLHFESDFKKSMVGAEPVIESEMRRELRRVA